MKSKLEAIRRLSHKLSGQDRPQSCAAVILAAGSSSRMGNDKILARLQEIPVLARTLRPFQDCERIQEIIVVTSAEKLEAVTELCREYNFGKVRKVVLGGKTRAESALTGVSELQDNVDLIAIHDGARPLVTVELIRRTVEAAAQKYAAVPAIRSTDTLKTAGEDGAILGSVDRDRTWRIQTPQVFKADLIKGALTKAMKQGIPLTDDSSAMDVLGVTTYIVEGEEENIKLTKPLDLLLAARTGESEMRIGQGYDVHRLVEGRRLILGGVEIPYEKGLLGHSDADVLTHALMDALLGAAALGDIGQHFPDKDPRYAGADSLELLRHVCTLLREAGYRVGNTDCTVIAQRPKLAGFIPEMRRRLAEVMEIPFDSVSVKATTEEGLGFTGEGSGIAAQAIALLLPLGE